MMRPAWPLALVLAALVGCGETDPSTINNNIPKTPTGDVPPPPDTGGAPVQKAFVAGPGPMKAPPGYPVPEGLKPPGAASEETKAEGEAPKAGEETKAEAPQAAAVKLTDEELAEVKKLPEADQALALAQGVCPISGEHLGSMGPPLKVTADGKTAFLCCKGCKADFDADPAAAIAKLNKK